MARNILLPPVPSLVPDGVRPAISVADDSTLEAWLSLPADDDRTLSEFAANPVGLVRRLPFPPPPPNRLVPDVGIHPPKPWPR